MDTNQILALIGVIVGVILRAYYPWLKAKAVAEKAGEKISFKPAYMASAIISLLVTALTAIYAIAAFTMPEATDVQSYAFFVTFGISYGYAFTSVLNLPVDAKVEPAPVA